MLYKLRKYSHTINYSFLIFLENVLYFTYTKSRKTFRKRIVNFSFQCKALYLTLTSINLKKLHEY